MTDVTNRFIEIYNYLLKEKIVDNKADFCRKIEISTSMFTEISKGRTNVGLNAVQKTVLQFPFVSAEYLLTGNGSLNNRVAILPHTPNANDKLTIVHDSKLAYNAPPTLGNFAPPTAPPTDNLGMPKVITINDKNEDVISLVGNKVAAGYLNGYADAEYVGRLPTMHLPNLKGGLHRAFEVQGHSMNPTLLNKSVVIGRYEESLKNIRDRRIYIVVTETEGLVIKRVLNRIEESGKLILISDNQNKKEFPNIILDADEVKELWYLRGGLMYEFPEPNEFYNRFNDLEATVTMMQQQLQNIAKSNKF